MAIPSVLFSMFPFMILRGHLEGIAPQAFPSVTTPVRALARNDILFDSSAILCYNVFDNLITHCVADGAVGFGC